MVIALIFSILAYYFSWNVDPGAVLTVGELAFLGPVWWLAVRKYKGEWSALGLRAFQGRVVLLGGLLMVFSFIFNGFYSQLLAFFDLQVQPDLSALFTEGSSPWPVLIAGAIVAPIAEEIFFRGFVFGGLRQRYGWHKAAIISSAIFAVFHLAPTSIIPVFVLGYIFAYLYREGNSIWPAVLMHILTNTLALIGAYNSFTTNFPGG
jgi:membrane protease YdiL (CAAX protease family)